MRDSKLRWLTVGVMTSGGAALLSLTSVMHAAFAYGQADPAAAPPDFHTTLPDIGLVIGGSGTPIPGTDYVGAAHQLYIDHNIPGVTEPGALAHGVFTPEGLYPLDGIRVLQLDPSVAQGVTILDNLIQANLANGDTTTVFGYSQSAEIASQEMAKLDPSGTPSNLPVNFVLVGDVDNPNGGLLERFNGFETTSGDTHSLPLSLPSLGITFNGATPDDSFPTAIYTLEYDGFADFPRYPLNFLADLNAFLGIRSLHGTYLNGGVNGSGPTPAEIAAAEAHPLATSGPTETSYYMIPETAPLVALLPKPLQDLLGPDLTYLINLGYGDGTNGYSDTAANVPTPFGLFPDVSLQTILSHLVDGAKEGWAAFQSDLSDPAAWTPSLSALAHTAVDTVSTDPAAAPSISGILHAFSDALSQVTGAVSGLTDVGNALATVLPGYDLSLFTENLSNGDLLDALGLPAAANTALYTLAAGFGVQILTNAFSAIAADFSGL